MMLAVATTVTLAAALLPGAFAIPDAHRALQVGAVASDPAVDAMWLSRGLSRMTIGRGDEDFLKQLRAATTVDANGDHHL